MAHKPRKTPLTPVATKAVGPTIREQIEPALRAAGFAPTARATGIRRASLHNWLAGGQTLSDRQIEALAAHLGLVVRLSPVNRP